MSDFFVTTFTIWGGLTVLAAAHRLFERWRLARRAREDWQELRLKQFKPSKFVIEEDYVRAYVAYHDPRIVFWMALAGLVMLLLTPVLNSGLQAGWEVARPQFALQGEFPFFAEVGVQFVFWTTGLLGFGVIYNKRTMFSADNERLLFEAEEQLDAVKTIVQPWTQEEKVRRRQRVLAEEWYDPEPPDPVSVSWFRAGKAPAELPSTNRPHMDAGVDWSEIETPAFYLPASAIEPETVYPLRFDTQCKPSRRILGLAGWDGRIHVQFWLGDAMLPQWIALEVWPDQVDMWLRTVEAFRERQPLINMPFNGATHPSYIVFEPAEAQPAPVYDMVHRTQTSQDEGNWVPFNDAVKGRVDITQVEASILDDLLPPVLELARHPRTRGKLDLDAEEQRYRALLDSRSAS